MTKPHGWPWARVSVALIISLGIFTLVYSLDAENSFILCTFSIKIT